MSVCKYDIELFGLIEEIEKRVNDKDKYKVMNWISYLLNGVQSHNLQRKMNRNLYAIKLLDNVINNNLDEPFWTLPITNKELPMLSLVKVKSALTNKFHKEISYKSIEEKGMMLYNTLTSNIDYIEKFELNQIMLETIAYQLRQRKEEQKIIIEEQNKEIKELRDYIVILEKRINIVLNHKLSNK